MWWGTTLKRILDTAFAIEDQNRQVLAGISRLEASVTSLEGKLNSFMGTVNNSLANLQTAEGNLETKLAALATAQKTAFLDLAAEVAALKNTAGVPTSAVDAITAKLNTLGSTIDTLSAAAASSDPGPQTPPAPPPTPAPAPTPTGGASTPGTSSAPSV